MKYYLLLFITLHSLVQCKNQAKKHKKELVNKSFIKYAKGFDIIIDGNEKKLILKRMSQAYNKRQTFILGNETNVFENKIKVPIQSIVLTSTNHIPILESLNTEPSLIGFPNTQYISSKITRDRIKKGKIMELGIKQEINTEKLINLKPDLVVGYSLHPNNKLYKYLKKINIPVILNSDWLEESPLGRAEWIKFFGVLYGKEKEADSIFSKIESEYLRVKSLVKDYRNKSTVISGNMFKDVWNVPAGNSYLALFFKDANLNYAWKDTQGTGSLNLNFESVLEKGKNADFWLNCGLFETMDQLKKSNYIFKNFKSFNNNNIYTIAHKKGETGGLIYFELSPMRPDLVLKDLIKITNPSLLDNYELTFFSKLK